MTAVIYACENDPKFLFVPLHHAMGGNKPNMDIQLHMNIKLWMLLSIDASVYNKHYLVEVK